MATTHANVRDSSAASRGGGDQSARQEPAEGLLSMARGRLKTEINARKDRVSGALDEVAETVRRIGVPLRDQSPALGGYADEAADRLKQLSTGLRERDVAELAEDVEAFARRYPRAFVATGFTAGLLAARFLRSSAPEGEPAGQARHERRPGGGGSGQPGPGRGGGTRR